MQLTSGTASSQSLQVALWALRAKYQRVAWCVRALAGLGAASLKVRVLHPASEGLKCVAVCALSYELCLARRRRADCC
jgi:hypothetical protein